MVDLAENFNSSFQTSILNHKHLNRQPYREAKKCEDDVVEASLGGHQAVEVLRHWKHLLFGAIEHDHVPGP